MRFLLFLLTVFLIKASLQAQNELPETDPLYQRVSKIYKRLQWAVGDYRKELPQLIVIDRVKRVASYRSGDNSLIIEQKAAEICLSMGKNADAALAFILGHELTHFYQNHDWEEAGFATTFMAEKELFNKFVHQEEEADLYGAFVAHLAGYDIHKVVPITLDRIYEAYDLELKMKNYPSLKNRKAVAYKVDNRIGELIKIYENANYYAALGWHIQAIQSYEHLLKYVKTKELYNNMGMALLAIAIQQRSADNYWYPVEVDLDHALRAYADKSQQELLALARQKLQIALQYDANYLIAITNLACVYDLQHNYQAAQKLLAEAQVNEDDFVQLAKLMLIKGVVKVHQQDIAAARQFFQKAHATTANSAVRIIAEHNLQVLEKGRSPLSTEPMSNMEDMLDGVPLLESPPSSFEQSLTLTQTFFERAILHFNTYPHSKLSCFEMQNPLQAGNSFFALQRSTQLKTKKGIQAGNTVSQVRQRYDKVQAPRTVQYHRGYFLVYRSLGLIFKVDQQEKVVEWALFLSY